MKRFCFGNLFIYFSNLAAIMLLFESCLSNNDSNQTSHSSLSAFTIIETDTITPLFSTYSKPDCHLKMRFEVPTEATSRKTLKAARTLIASLSPSFECTNTSDDIESMIQQYSRLYCFNYLEEGIDAIANYGDDVEESANWMTYEEISEGKVLYNERGIFSYSVVTYSFTGGAHGNSTNRVASLDLDKKKVIALDYLFDTEKQEVLREEILSTLNSEYQLLTDEIDVTNNFYLDSKGITFVYDPLDIAAYSDGEIDVTISWDKISAMIKPGLDYIIYK